MKKIMLIGCAMFFGVMLLTSKADAAGIKEGQWATTMTIQMGGAAGQEMAQAQKEMANMSQDEKAMMKQMMGGMGMQMGARGGGGMTVNSKQCLTNDHPVPQKEDQKDCQETHKIKGNTVQFEVTCKDSHSTGEVTYKNESMTGTIQSTQMEKGKEEKVTIDLKGQYEGPCS